MFKLKYLETLYAALKTKYESEYRDGVHVSDLTLCPRESIFRRLNPQPITNKQLNFFTSGRAIHEAIQNLADYDGLPQYNKDQHKSLENWRNLAKSKRFEIEKEVNFEGISGHIDLYDSVNNIPIECKTYRAKSIEKPKPFHIDQLKSYMAMVNSRSGTIIYQLLMNFDDNPFVEFEIEMTDEELNSYKNKLRALYEDYKTNLDKKDPMGAIYVYNNADLNWKCKSCSFFEQCQGVKK